jgi:hypothetical protein
LLMINGVEENSNSNNSTNNTNNSNDNNSNNTNNSDSSIISNNTNSSVASTKSIITHVMYTKDIQKYTKLHICPKCGYIPPATNHGSYHKKNSMNMSKIVKVK